jgi:hypothetical protein
MAKARTRGRSAEASSATSGLPISELRIRTVGSTFALMGSVAFEVEFPSGPMPDTGGAFETEPTSARHVFNFVPNAVDRQDALNAAHELGLVVRKGTSCFCGRSSVCSRSRP